MNSNRLPRTALITGASSGIGYELSKLFAKDHYRLILIARNKKKLEEVENEMKNQFPGVEIKIIAKDISMTAASQEIFEELQKDKIHVDILVNNAGFGTYGFFMETNLTTELEMIQTNITALTYLCKLFGREMFRKKQGKILNIASTAAFQPGPLMAVYFATKAFVLSFSEALANEFQGTGVSVTALCPGPTATGFEKRAHLEKSKLFKGKTMNAATVAKIGYHGLMKNKTVIIPGFKNKFLAETTRFVPRNIVTKIVRHIQEKTTV